MGITTIQDILPLVDKPSRYLGTEINCIKKDHSKVKLSIALAFPDMYDIGTAHFGLQILYYILNKHKDIAAERVFVPGIDMQRYLKRESVLLSSLESGKPLKQFDIVGFSLLYELNYTGILNILDLADIPFYSKDRDDTHPLIIAGGPCTSNPEPVADFFDAMVIGDGERVITEIAHGWQTWRVKGFGREALLKKLSEIEGVYIPSFFRTEYESTGFQKLVAEISGKTSVKRAIIKPLTNDSFPDSPVIPFGRPVQDRLRLEIARGCTRGCRFCQAGMIYRPVRERLPTDILELAERGIVATGYEDLSLLSLSTGDYSCIGYLLNQLMDTYERKNISISLPSLRADTLTPEVVALVKKVRKTGFTIAPEAGSQRLRNVINKNISEEEILKTVKLAFDSGWNLIKLYFMIGLPSETDEDLRCLISMVKTLRKIKGHSKGRRKEINIGISTFIPKPHTPFQWEKQISLNESREKIFRIKDGLKISGVSVKWQNPEMSVIEGLFARGDRRMNRLLVSAYEKGCRLDGWDEFFQYGIWLKAFSEAGIDKEFYLERKRELDEPLPWDHIDTKVKKDYLIKEKEKSLNEELTKDCRTATCNNCGVCDPETVNQKSNVINKNEKITAEKKKDEQGQRQQRVRVVFSKTGNAKYFGHLELVNIFIRAIRRVNIPVVYSKGFHPKPKISFEDPLPIGIESREESFCLTIAEMFNPDILKERLNGTLPDGLAVKDCRIDIPVYNGIKKPSFTYLVILENGVFDPEVLEKFYKTPVFVYAYKNSKGNEIQMDLKEIVSKIEILAPDRLQMILKSTSEKTLRPVDVIAELFSIKGETARRVAVIKTPC